MPSALSTFQAMAALHGTALDQGADKSKYFALSAKGDLPYIQRKLQSLPYMYILAVTDSDCVHSILQLSSRQRHSYLRRLITRPTAATIQDDFPLTATDLHVICVKNPGEAQEAIMQTYTQHPDRWRYEKGTFKTPREAQSNARMAEQMGQGGFLVPKKDPVLEAVDKLKALCADCESRQQAFMACSEEMGAWMHHFEKVWEYEQYRKEDAAIERMRLKAESQVLRPWQTELENRLRDFHLNEDADRKVIVVLDEAGGAGKSFLVRHYIHKYPHSALNVAQGKTMDMLNFIYNSSGNLDVMFLDLTRFQRDNANLSVVETIKNGVVPNHKYHTGQKTLEHSPAWVIMTNSALDWTKFTTDRWIILQPQRDGTAKWSTHGEYVIANPPPPADAPNYVRPENLGRYFP